MTTNNLIDEIINSESAEEQSIFNSICQLLDNIKTDEKNENTDQLVNELSEYLGLGKFQTIIFCTVFIFQFERNRHISYEDLSEALGVSTLQLLKQKKQIEEMVEKKYLVKETYRRGRRFFDDDSDDLGNLCFYVPNGVAEAILDNKPIVISAEEDSSEDMEKFLNEIDDLINLDSENSGRLKRAISRKEGDWERSKTIQKITKRFPETEERYLFYIFCSDRLYARSHDTPLAGVLKCLIANPKQRMDIGRKFMSGEYPLLKSGFIELEDADFFDKANVSLTDSGLEYILGETAEIYTHTASSPDLIPSEKIIEKKLFYSDSMQKQLDTLYDIMDDEKFKKLQARLSKKGMTRGIACLLYGAPGTGKTESVYQIARKTGRSIHHVDISEAKTCWFGESQKRVKRIFTTYQKECDEAKKHGKKIPILLLNEADAILSKRKDSSSSNLAQEENAIQNILLECIENLEGILIATTNIADNLDAAFERRFLFKLEYTKPEPETRSFIWKDKLSFLKKCEARDLAAEFEFSGGEIDNIARKIEIEQILKGKKPPFDDIKELCRHEKLAKDGNHKIGFGL